MPATNQWYAVEITDLYNAWKSGTYPNYGLQLRPVSYWNNFNNFYSSDYTENPLLRPKLVILYTAEATPANDLFTNRIAITGTYNTVNGANVGATKETGEPNHAGNSGGKSVWWTWTAPGSGLVTITTDGSSFDTTLAVYTGTAVGSLILMNEDDDGGEGWCSRVVFNAIAGTTYQIAVDGFGGASGGVTLSVKLGLLNDAFAERLQITGTSDLVTGSNVGATWEAGEPFHWDSTGTQSVWWTWQAPQSGTVTISTAGSSFDTILAAYTGNSVSGLALVANNDDTGGVTSQISYFATAGTVYQIAVDGYGAASGTIRLLVQQ